MVPRHQGQVELASGNARNERGRLLAVELDLDAPMTGRESLEDRREVLARVVVRHPEPHQSGDGLALKGRLRLALEVEHAPRITQQHLTLVRELELPRPPHQQLASRGQFQLLDLHAHRRLGTVDLRRSARQRPGVDGSDEGLQPVCLQVSHPFDNRMIGCRIIRFSGTCRRGTVRPP